MTNLIERRGRILSSAGIGLLWMLQWCCVVGRFVGLPEFFFCDKFQAMQVGAS